MIRLKNLSKKQISYSITRCPISNTQKSSNPGEIWNPEKPGEKIINPNLKTELDEIVLRAGETVEFKGKPTENYNDEQAEYLYRTLGVPEMGGSIPVGSERIKVTNANYLIEVDEKDKEIKTNLFKKYRTPKVPELRKDANFEAPLPELAKAE